MTAVAPALSYEEALEALEHLAGRAVAVDVFFTTTLANIGDMPPPRSEDAWSVHEGVLEVTEVEQPIERGVDAAAWWQEQDKMRVRIHPEGGVLFSRGRFKDAYWENNVLVIQVGGVESRIVPLVRPSGTYVIKRPAIQLAG
jgi:hypothetical protein